MFAVVDVETTGLRPARDRVVEVAVVRLDEGRNVVRQWTTLVDPGGPVRGSKVHGIYTRHVQGAPSFADIAGDLAELLAGAVFVAHNARFDVAFVEAEYRRVGVVAPLPWLCTLEMAAALNFSANRSLRACCANLGLQHDHGHAALVDAEAAARLLAFLLAAAYEQGHEVAMPAAPVLPAMDPCGRVSLRPAPAQRSGPLRRLVSSLPPGRAPAGADAAATLAYTEMLDRVLEDRRLTQDEVLALCQLAATWGLTPDQLTEIHRGYLSSLVDVCMADGVLSRSEHEDLRLFAGLLGVDRQAVLDDIAATLE